MYELPLLIELIEFEKKKEVGTILNGPVREYFFLLVPWYFERNRVVGTVSLPYVTFRNSNNAVDDVRRWLRNNAVK